MRALTTNWFFLSILFLVASLPSPSFAASDTDGDGYVTVLVPIAFSFGHRLPGTHGSLWAGEVWAHNASETTLPSLQPAYCSLPAENCPLDGFAAGFSGILSLASNRNDGGALLWIPAALNDQIHLGARLKELSRNAQPLGVEIPIVREGEFFSEPTEYLAVPSGAGLRSTVRVYDPRIRRGSSVRVDFMNTAGVIVASRILSPGNDQFVPEIPPQPPEFQHYPGGDAIHTVTDVFPELREHEFFHVRVTPLTVGMEYWAMVSVTDNETQHVLLISAQ